jgi:hypothetical protein
MVRQWVEVILLHTFYAETQGQVLERWIESDEGATYYVTYRFVAGDQVHTVEEVVAKKTYQTYMVL